MNIIRLYLTLSIIKILHRKKSFLPVIPLFGIKKTKLFIALPPQMLKIESGPGILLNTNVAWVLIKIGRRICFGKR